MSLQWDAAALDRLSTVTPETIERARAHWRRWAAPRDRALLDDGCDDERQCRAALDRYLDRGAREVAALAAQLATRTLDVAAFQLAMAEHVTLVQLCALAAARGGWSRITLEDITR